MIGFKTFHACCLCFAILIPAASLTAQLSNPLVGEIISRVSTDTLLATLNELSGEKAALIDGIPQTIATRHMGTAGHRLATAYLRQKLQSYRLSPILQVVDSSVTNVLLVQRGSVYPGRTWIICAHYDDNPSGALAPGADDNGTGTAAVLEAARILSRYQTQYTITYALWDSEEHSTVGSVYYASQAHARKDTIAGVINVDMIGYDKNNDGRMEIHARPSSLDLARSMVSLDSVYQLGLLPVIYNPGQTNSDHGSFWEWNYLALWLIESYVGGDFNPGYHSTSDRVSSLNAGYFSSITRMAVGALASASKVVGPVAVLSEDRSVPSTVELFQNWPNPFNSTTVISGRWPNAPSGVEGTAAGHVRLAIYDMLGRVIAVLIDETRQPGGFEVTWNASGLSSGVYLLKLTAGSHTVTRKMTLLR